MSHTRQAPVSLRPLAVAAALLALAGGGAAAPVNAGQDVFLDIVVGGKSIGETFWVNAAGQQAAHAVAVTVRDASAAGHGVNRVAFGQARYADEAEHFVFAAPTGPFPGVAGWTAGVRDADPPDGPDGVVWAAAPDGAFCATARTECSPRLAPGVTHSFSLVVGLRIGQGDFSPQRFHVVATNDATGYGSDPSVPVIFLGNDATPPAVALTMDDGSSGAGRDDASLYHREETLAVRLEASDGLSGLASLTLAVDGEAVPACPAFAAGATTPVVCDLSLAGLADGVHTVQALATDVAGNPASPPGLAVRVDRTAPTAAFWADTQANANGWHNVHPAIQLEATDCLSDCAGLGTLLWSHGGTAGPSPDLASHPPYLVLTANASLPDGVHAFTAQVADAAHAPPHAAPPVEATFRVDATPPASNASFTLEPAPGHATGHTLRFRLRDDTSRLQAFTLSYSGSQGAANGNVPCAQAFAPDTTSHECVLAIPADLDVGRHAYTATATDMAGNVAARQAILFRGSTSQPPQASFPAPAPPPPPDDGRGGGGGADPDATLRLAPVKASFTGVPVTSRVTLQARAGDADHAPLAGRAVEWRVVSGSGTLSGTATPTDGNGIAAVVLTPGATPGTVRVNASLAGREAAFTVTTAVGPAARILPVGPAVLEATAGTRHEVRAQVVDAHGNPVPGQSVQWRLAGPGSLSAPATTTGADGVAAVTLSLGPAGTTTVSAAGDALAGGPVTYTLHAKAPARLATAREVFTVPLGSPQVLQVAAQDAAGAPRAGVPVAWSLLRGVGELAQAASVTGPDGTARVAFTPLVGGLLEVQAASPGLAGSPVVFTVAALVPDPPAGEAAPPSWTQAIRDAGRIQLPDGALSLERTPAGLLSGLRDRSGTLATVRSDPQLGLVLLQVHASGALVLVQADGRAFPVRPQHGTLLADAADPANRSREVTVSVPAKEGWILVDVEDPHPDHAIAGLRDLAGRILPTGLAWRHQGSLFFLDEPGTTYAIRMQEAPAGPPQLDAGVAALVAGGAAAGLAALAWAARRARRGGQG